MGISLLQAPTAEPVSLEEAKAHCRVDIADDDALFTGIIIPAAREAAEKRTGRALVTQKWKLTLAAFPEAFIETPKPPLVSVESIKYVDAEGTLQTLDASAYTVHPDELVGLVAPAYDTKWPETREQLDAVRIEFTAGYGSADAVPASIKAWMLLAIGTLYEYREALAQGQVIELPGGFWHSLLEPYSIPVIV